MLRDALRQLITDLKDILQDSSLPPVARNKAPPSSLDDFKQLLSMSQTHGRVPESCLPDEIPFGPSFAERLNRLRLQSLDGNERARVVFYQRSWNKFVFGPTHIGDRQSVPHSTILPERFRGRGCLPVLSVHSHPLPADLISILGKRRREHWARSVNRSLEHFSPADIESLVSGPVMGFIVVTPGRSLMALRTEGTPVCLSEGELSERTKHLMERAQQGPYGGEAARVFTKLSCLDFGLSLYISAEDDSGTFRKVLLRRAA